MDTREIETWIGTDPIAPYPRDSAGGGTIGAVVEFSGMVRNTERGRTIEALYYEAHPDMAAKLLRSIAQELSAIHGVRHVVVAHRLGWVEVGQISFYLRVESAHRAEALRFCADYIDRLKQDVPIWKSDQREAA